MTTKQDSPFPDAFLDEMRRRLFAWRTRAAGEYRDLEDVAMKPSGQDASFEQPADFGTEEFAAEINQQILGQEARLLQDIDAAILRLDGQGPLPYGLCEDCEPAPQRECPTCPWIAEARLREVPWATRCAPRQERAERS